MSTNRKSLNEAIARYFEYMKECHPNVIPAMPSRTASMRGPRGWHLTNCNGRLAYVADNKRVSVSV